MELHERRMIDDLFAKLKQAEQQAGPRDREAEEQISEALSRQPAAPYYMSRWFGQNQTGGSGFLGSAMQTAAGVAGGMLLANAASGLFGGGQAQAAGLEGAAADAEAAARAEEQAADPLPPDDFSVADADLYADSGGDFDTFGDF